MHGWIWHINTFWTKRVVSKRSHFISKLQYKRYNKKPQALLSTHCDSTCIINTLPLLLQVHWSHVALLLLWCIAQLTHHRKFICQDLWLFTSAQSITIWMEKAWCAAPMDYGKIHPSALVRWTCHILQYCTEYFRQNVCL